MIELQTPRLRLRPFRESDLGTLHAINTDPVVMRFLSNGQPLALWQSWNQIATFIGHWRLRGYGMFLVEERETGRFAGRVGLLDPAGWPGLELGWTTARPFWGRGYATEAARAVRDWAFESGIRDHLLHLIDPANAASIAVARKLGAQRNGCTEVLGRALDIWRTDRGAALPLDAARPT